MGKATCALPIVLLGAVSLTAGSPCYLKSRHIFNVFLRIQREYHCHSQRYGTKSGKDLPGKNPLPAGSVSDRYREFFDPSASFFDDGVLKG